MRGLALPGCGLGVIPPNSKVPKPTLSNALELHKIYQILQLIQLDFQNESLSYFAIISDVDNEIIFQVSATI